MSHQPHHRPPARNRPPASRAWGRAFAAALCLLLAFASIAPAFAEAREVDSEGEGLASPGPIVGIEAGPEFEPGEETPLGEVPAGGEEGEEEPVPVPTEPEAPPAPEPVPPELPVGEVAPEVEVPPVEPPPPAPSSGPVYEEEPTPNYDADPAPAEVVENESLSAPPDGAAPNQPRVDRGGNATPVAPGSQAPPPPAPPEMPQPDASVPPPATPVEREAPPGSLRGRSSHVVRSGECLWSIAAALLPVGSSDAGIAAEVRQLWQLNEKGSSISVQ